MTSTDTPWWGYLLQWSSTPLAETAEVGDEHGSLRVGVTTVPNYYTPPGARETSHVWCLADPSTGLPGAVLSDRRYVARALAEAALTEAFAAGAKHASAAVDRIDGIASLMAVLGSSGPAPIPLGGAWLVAAAEPHRSRIRVHATAGTSYAAEHVADVVPVWGDSPVPSWRIHYAGSSTPPALAPSWHAAAAAIITATTAEGDHR